MNKNKLIALIHRVSEEKGIPFNAVLTHYFLEEILKRIAESSYLDNFIFKGGFLLSNVYGINSRTTVDMDLLVTKTKVTEQSVLNIFTEILSKNGEGVAFKIIRLEVIRTEDKYNSYRLHVLGTLENIKVQIPIDIATGDIITPAPINYEFKSNFNHEKINMISYNIETVLAEKLQTLYERNIFNSRSKDFYDIYMMYKMQEIDYVLTKTACENTFSYRDTLFSINEIMNLTKTLKNNQQFQDRWVAYTNKFPYASGISFVELMDTINKLLLKIETAN